MHANKTLAASTPVPVASRSTAGALQFHLLSGRRPAAADSPRANLYNSAFKLWRERWDVTLRGTDGMDSDAFAFADYIGVVTQNNQPEVVALFYMLDLNQESHRNISFLAHAGYDSHIVQDLIARGKTRLLMPRALVGRPGSGLPSARLMFNLMGRFLQESGAHALLAPGRSDRGLPQLIERLGGKIVQRDVGFRGLTGHLMQLEPHDVKPDSSPEICQLRDRLWTQARTKVPHIESPWSPCPSMPQSRL